MNNDFPDIKIHIKIADVRDIDTMEKIFQEVEPEVIFHAAAHKHVPLMEANPAQAIFNNVGGTKNLSDLALEYNVKYFVNISTDKAVNPTSIMGASKRIAEYIVQNAAAKAGSDQYFVSVRFGNVLGSRGSVVPIFINQIRNGGPVTITHPEVKRYFMTIPEAVLLVMQAGEMGKGGEVFVLDMGEPVKILDMAKQLIQLHGLEPETDIPIEFIGLRPGEKMFEELLKAEEGVEETSHELIHKAICSKEVNTDELTMVISRMLENIEKGNMETLRHHIKKIVPTYSFKNSQKTPQNGHRSLKEYAN
jgi:FlaA1/EpsC-like NDP-sugar epimerase